MFWDDSKMLAGDKYCSGRGVNLSLAILRINDPAWKNWKPIVRDSTLPAFVFISGEKKKVKVIIAEAWMNWDYLISHEDGFGKAEEEGPDSDVFVTVAFFSSDTNLKCIWYFLFMLFFFPPGWSWNLDFFWSYGMIWKFVKTGGLISNLT